MDFEFLIARFHGPLAGMFASWGVSWHDSHELAQDSFAEAFLGRDRFRGDPQDLVRVGRWLRGIAKNRYRLWSRDRAKRAADEFHPDIEVSGIVDLPPPAIVELRAAIDRLPTKLRVVIYMHYLEETQIAAIAGLLRVSEKTIEGRLYRARNLLRDRLKACDQAAAPFGGPDNDR